MEGPRIVAAGRGITSTGGHGGEVGRICDGIDEVRKGTREQFASGAGVDAAGAAARPAAGTLHGRSSTRGRVMFDPPLAQSDPEIAKLIADEERRESEKIRLIPSENYASRAVLEATGSIFTNKYSEGYAGKRYYEGQQYIDRIEQLCIDRAKGLFGADHANVQPYSGSPANLAIYFAFLKPGDTVMGMALPAGGHLTHGWNVSITGKFFRSVAYGVKKETGRVDLDEVRELAKKERPKLLWCGGTAIPPQGAP